MGIKQELIDYSNDIVSGKIVACQKHIWACERFLRDISNENTEQFPYYFDENEVNTFLNFMGLFRHTKGPLKNQLIVPHIFQKFIAGNIYGWYNRETMYRRFQKVYLQIARKNGKSQLLSIITAYEAMSYSPEQISEVYCAATKKLQADIVYDETLRILEKCTALKGKWFTKGSKIIHKRTKSFIRSLSKEDKTKGDGLFPQCASIDEYHAHDTTEVLDVIESGMTQCTEPLLVIITTAGFNLNSPCYRIEYNIASQILDPEKEAKVEHEFAMICELEVNQTSENIILEDGKKIAPGELIDDINDERNWIKANPIVCSTEVGISNIRKRLEDSKLAPEKEKNLFTKFFNIWVNLRTHGYMNVKKWVACEGKVPSVEKLSSYIGIDISSRVDLTSISFVFPIENDKYIVLSHSFIPYSRLQARLTTGNMPFDVWVKDGWITVVDKEVIDYIDVINYGEKWIKEKLCIDEEWCIDPWSANQISNRLIERGKEVVEIRQGIPTLAEPTRCFREEVYAGNIIHDGNPVLKWAIGNAVVSNVDRNDNFLVSKKDSPDKIDPLAATLNAFTRAMVNKVVTRVYETRGLRSLD